MTFVVDWRELRLALPMSLRRQSGCADTRQLLLVVLLGCMVSLGQCANPNYPSNSGSKSNQQDTELESVSDLAPSAIHWALAVVLGLALIGGLIRVARILQKDDSIIPMRHAPDGMRAVQCGACTVMQHVTMHGRIFICFSCHSANRIAMDPASIEEPQLVAATGPLRKFEFKREGENFFAESARADIQDEEANACLAQPFKVVKQPANPLTATAASCCAAPPVPTEDKASGDIENNNATAKDLEAGENTTPGGARPAPQLLGHSNMDLELISNGSKKSKQSRLTESGGLPTCVVCLEEPGNMVLLPCAHGGVCDGCTTRIAQNRAWGGAHCPHCRSVIDTLVKIHEVDGLSVKGVEFRIPIARV